MNSYNYFPFLPNFTLISPVLKTHSPTSDFSAGSSIIRSSPNDNVFLTSNNSVSHPPTAHQQSAHRPSTSGLLSLTHFDHIVSTITVMFCV